LAGKSQNRGRGIGGGRPYTGIGKEFDVKTISESARGKNCLEPDFMIIISDYSQNLSEIYASEVQ
jgi:hypothetical protein